ncbi:glycosyltransferase [Ornithinimicrobium sp. LYQ92]|uniref:glycosyltransferase n=1 Tax=Serinicoccus sp. LYQ92 TaxID=3378798 RepID=UPI00385265F6
MTSRDFSPVASVVIPAHNEGRSIAACLAPLVSEASGLPLEIVVAANGCTDDTAAVARHFSGVTVLEVPEPSKTGAMNAADQVASCFPRFYLDADVCLDREAIHGLVEALTTSEPRLAAPGVRHDTAGADVLVRHFYAMYRLLPSSAGTAVGRGVYGLSCAGRARFDTFPPVQGDDLFVNRLFTPSETVLTRGTSTVRTPRRWTTLVKVRSRVAQGNARLAKDRSGQLGTLARTHDFAPTTGSTVRALIRLVRQRPSRLPSAVTYASLTLIARAHRTDHRTWQRDDSTR